MNLQSPDRLAMLERAVLELGSEVYSLKATLAKSDNRYEQVIRTLQGLKQLLDEKGLVTPDDFEAAIDLGEALEKFTSQAEHALYQELEKVKKAGH